MGPPYPSPALPPPPGQTSNFADPVSTLRWDILCITICLTVTTIVFSLRVWVRLVVLKQWILEDYMCCISYIGLVIFCTLTNILFKRHGGVHAWDLTLPESYIVNYWFNVIAIEYAPAILCTKLTVLLLYRRVFLPHRWSIFDINLRVFMVVCSLYYLTTIPVKIWECIPRARIWNKSIEGTCIRGDKVLNADGVFNTLSDFYILLVPIKALWNLQMKTRRKIGICLLFTVGLIAPVFSIIGWVVRLRDSSSADTTYNDPEIVLWGTAELSAGVICICLPTVPAMLSRRRTGRSDRNLEMDSRSRHLQTLTRRLPTSLSDQDPFNREYLGLCGGHVHDGGVGASSTTVAADIEEGKPGGMHANGPRDLEAKEDELIQKPAIMKTVVIEQSNDVRR